MRLVVLALMLTATTPALAETAAEPTSCVRSPGGNVVVPILGEYVGFHPSCVIIDSGATVVWRNDDAEPHNAGSADGGGQCFLASRDLGESQPPFTSYSVRFSYDGADARSQYGGGNLRPCVLALDPQHTNADQAAIRYKCYEHGVMTGTVIVLRGT